MLTLKAQLTLHLAEIMIKMGLFEKAKLLIRVSDEKGKWEYQVIKEGQLSKKCLNSKDVFIIDTGKNIICYIGKDCSKAENAKAMMIASAYIRRAKRPPWIPLTRIREGQAQSYIDSLFTD